LRNLEDIEKDLAAAREALSSVEGTPAEVYSRIVGYYRSVRNWNKGKREEYGERRLFAVPEKGFGKGETEKSPDLSGTVFPVSAGKERSPLPLRDKGARLLLFVRPACPACPAAKAAAGRLGIPVDTVNADTEEGLAEAGRRNVMSTPTAILLTRDGKELGRALDSGSIAAFGSLTASRKDEALAEAVS
jgi:ribonucleoside-triphosphate reductase